MAAKHQRNGGGGVVVVVGGGGRVSPALQEKWNLEKPACLGLVVPAADEDNCAEFIKPHLSRVIASMLP